MNTLFNLLSITGLLLSIILSPVYCVAEVYSKLSIGPYIESNKLTKESGLILKADVGIRQLAGFGIEAGFGVVLSLIEKEYSGDKGNNIMFLDTTIKHELEVKGGSLSIGAGIGYYSFTYGNNPDISLTEKGMGPHLILEMRDNKVFGAIRKSFLYWEYDNSGTIDYGGWSISFGLQF